MTSQELYKNFQLKLNKLDTGDNIDISEGEFVIIYNEVQNKWFESKYRNVASRYRDDVQFLIEPDYNLGEGINRGNYVEYTIPPNYFDYIRSYSLASKGECKNLPLYNEEVKIVNLSEYLKNNDYSPSFEYETTLVVLAKNKIQVYITDFIINSVFCTYYRYPKQIDIEGYTKFGVSSTTINPELPDAMANEVIDMVVLETQRRYSDIEGFQLSQNREQTNP